MNNLYSKQFENQLLKKLKDKRNEICAIAPQEMGFLTPLYKRLTARLKISPWKIFLPFSLFLSFLSQILLGHWSTKIVSVLQASF
ncbi:hypothetical protein HY345_00620 [Candidatus Microgenomates bacterium]|nr:hypothetical protein [Candidatus Microgenomates bacterium]